MAVFVSSLPPAVHARSGGGADCEYVSSNMVIHLRRKFFWKKCSLADPTPRWHHVGRLHELPPNPMMRLPICVCMISGAEADRIGRALESVAD